MWNDFLGGDQGSSSDPLDLLKSIAGSAPPQNAIGVTSRVPRIPNVPTAAIPQKPVPGPIETAVHPQGSADWPALLAQLGPLLGSLALHEPGQRAGFLGGYTQGQQLGAAEREKKQAAKQAKDQAAGRFLLEAGQHALSIDDPVQRSQFVDLVESSGVTAGLLTPNDPRVAKLREVPASQSANAKLKELSDLLDGVEKNGYNLDELAQAGAHLRTKTGEDVPVQTALDLTRKRPLGSNGQPIAKPGKIGNTEEERYVDKWAKEHGKTSDALTAAEELTARKAFREAGRADAKPPTVPQGGVEAQFADLVSLWKESHPGQDPPANVRTQLRKQANEVNDRPQTLGGMDSLYRDVDPKAIAAQIRLGDHPPDITQYGRPVAAAVASELAKSGPHGEPPFNLARAQREWRAQLNLNRTMNGSQQVRLDESIRSGLAMYDRIDQLAEQWDGKGWGPLSRANLALAREGAKGPAAQSLANQLTGQIGQLTSDVATIEQGGLTPTNEARAVAEKSMQDWWGKGTIKDMTAQGRANMQIRHLARNTQETLTPGNGPDLTPARPATPAPAAGRGAAPIKVGGFTVTVK